ncbi:Double-stranded RNA-binding domain [Dillenia turbinata]|uniref:Double-stranded RNA-binding domain n=1 Tax=Dillenia turbinata TaxID=194707 RepID=A0AAN8VGX2_9MAGN
MYKNQLQELAQRSCFNLPSYTCIREGPDHAPRFKATVNFNGEIFESPNYCTTLRQAEHSAAEVALNSLSSRGPSHSLAARILDETGVYKNLLQEISQRVGASLPLYTTFRSGLGHLPVFTCTVELAGVTFTGEPAKNKKQAEKNAALAAWSSLKELAQQSAGSSSEPTNHDEQEHITIARALQNYLVKAMVSNSSFPVKFPMQKPKQSSTQPSPITTSKILPLIRPQSAPRSRPISTTIDCPSTLPTQNERPLIRPQKFPAVGAAPYVPVRHIRPYHGVAPPVTIRTSMPVFSAPPVPPSLVLSPQVMSRPTPLTVAPPICVRQAVPVSAAPPVKRVEHPVVVASTTPPANVASTTPPANLSARLEDTRSAVEKQLQESVMTVLEDLKI